MKDNPSGSRPTDPEERPEQESVTSGRRDAAKKLAYVTPAIAGLLFTNRAVAQFSNVSPPPTP